MSTTSQPYVDVYLLPVPTANIEKYRAQASAFGAVARECGALSSREFLADDPGDNMKLEDGLVMTAAVVEFTSREHRDQVMDAVMADPRVQEMAHAEQVTDLSRMMYGGFKPLVTA
jgi:uncharacterized protein YbaA (DUF1428 family)